MDSKCATKGCDEPPFATNGLCARHYALLLEFGNPQAKMRPGKGTPWRWIWRIAAKYHGNECLIWPYKRNSQGYAYVHIGRKLMLVSRLLCFDRHGRPDNKDMHAAHTCGNGHLGCVSPAHLFWKTASQNEADKVLHGTAQQGGRHWCAKLTDEDILAIRAVQDFRSRKELAKAYGVSETTIYRILRRKTWRHLK